MSAEGRVYVIEDDIDLRNCLDMALRGAGYTVELFGSAEEFLESYRDSCRGCLLLDMKLPHMSGCELQQQLSRLGAHLAMIAMSGTADIALAVKAMEAGAVSFIQKPFGFDELSALVKKGLHLADEIAECDSRHKADQQQIAALSRRELEVMKLAVCGQPTKSIARRLGISKRTIDKHRQRILAKTHAESWADLVALSVRLEARMNGHLRPPEQPRHTLRYGPG